MPRTVIVHLNVQVPDEDDRSAEDVAEEIRDAILRRPHLASLPLEIPLFEEV